MDTGDQQPPVHPDDARERPPFRLRLAESLRILWRITVILGVIALFLLIPTLLNTLGLALPDGYVDFSVVMFLGALVGFVEIISRYQDAPFRMVLTWPGIVYMWVNALVAASALWLIRLFEWDFLPAAGSDPEAARWAQVLVAGLGAMAIFRSSIFVLGKEEDQVSVGPNAVLVTLLSAIDKEVDRHRGQERARTVKRLIEKMQYDDVTKDLRLISQFLMQNLSADDIKRIFEAQTQVETLSNDPEVRKYLLGLRIIDVVGEDVLRQAISIRGSEHYARKYKDWIEQQADGSAKEPKPSGDGARSTPVGIAENGPPVSLEDVIQNAARESQEGGEADGGGVG